MCVFTKNMDFNLDDYAIGPFTMPDSTNRFLLIMCCFCTSALAPPNYGTA